MKTTMGQNKVCALIPARSGSKGLPNKNKLAFAGSTLTQIALEKACRSNLISDVAVSTDDIDIFHAAASLPTIPNPIRLPSLSTDDARIIDVALDFLRIQEQYFGKTWEYLILVEPTAPLRTSELLDQGISFFLRYTRDFDACVSVGQLNFGLDSLFQLQGRTLKPLRASADPKKRRQEQENLFFPYGIFYLVKVEALKKFQTFYPPNTLGFQVPDNVCVEVDSLGEFQMAEHMYIERGLR